MTELSAGMGLCRATAQLSVRPVRAVIELGAVADVIHAALNAAHHANRQGDPDEMIAVALPGLHLHRGVARPGHEVMLFGSEDALGRYMDLDGVRTLVRRGMVAAFDVTEAWPEAGAPGTAYLRDRSVARPGPSALRRLHARAERRGVAGPDRIEPRAPDLTVLALHYGPSVVHVRELEAQVTDAPLRVSTYGFSAPGTPAVLPIQPDGAARWADDAA